MIVAKNLRADVLGEPLFEKVNFVIQSGERIAFVASEQSQASLFLRMLAGDEEMEDGTVTTEGERVEYVSPEIVRGGTDALAQAVHARPTFLLLDCGTQPLSTEVTQDLARFIRAFKGGMIIASPDTSLMQIAKTTRVFELHTSLKTITSYTGTYDTYLVEKEKNDERANEAYKKQQREKQRLESWLEKKREEASIDRSPDKGATIRTKVKYLKREILDKELPKPASLKESEDEFGRIS